MVENEEKITDTELQKKKIRERYKGVDPDILEVIPATKKQVDFYDEEPKRVAVYVRVSTDDPRQTSSFELQKNYYEDMVTRYPSWTLVDIYADEGISGTSLNHRDNFLRMIQDAKNGRMDIIITKSVSRFARNIVDCIQIVRDLAALKTPVGVFFETEHIYTLKDNTEMSLSFIATMAQEESHVKSSIMNASIEMRFSHGILLTPVLLGYDHDSDGNLVINEDEANTVRLIFFMYLYGYTCAEIAETLTKLNRKTKKGNTHWSATSVLNVLKNERHCGDVLSHKTFTPSYLDHKTKKNEGDKPQYRFRDHHDAIISRDDFIAVQHMIDNAKYGSKGILPHLQVIPEGMLKGFVAVNLKWSGFKPDDYKKASNSVYQEENSNDRKMIVLRNGDFNYTGFQIARGQFFDGSARLSVTLSAEQIKFSKGCVEILGNQKSAELLVHPGRHILALRPITGKSKNAVKWGSLAESGDIKPRYISGLAYLPTLFDLFEWNRQYKYRLRGYVVKDETTEILLFNVDEPEVIIPQERVKEQVGAEEKGAPLVKQFSSVIAYPQSWSDEFGEVYYQSQTEKTAGSDNKGDPKLAAEFVPYETGMQLKITDSSVIEKNIHSLISTMKEGEE